ncbi:MAG: carbon monoxide dehydrogenase [Coriobacteriia bacterium]|nr:carbon monoxide dehydrogenase [Coriobacteriia bacterium]
MERFVRCIGCEIPTPADVAGLTPNPASREMLGRLAAVGVETAFDRFEAQQPQCPAGLRGTCCRMCQWGPCRITQRSPRGVCGRDMPQVVMANVIRSLAAGMAAHGRHAHEVVLAVIAAAGGADIPLRGERRIRELAEAFGLDGPAEDGSPAALPELAERVARALLDDLGRLTAEPMSTLEAFAPADRRAVWQDLGILPRSASYETMETLHMTTLGGCSDWRAMAAQELRDALAYCYGTLFTSSLATEMLYGVPEPRDAEVDYGILKPGHVNVLVHGHSPVMVEAVIDAVRSERVEALAREAGAEGVVLGGMCCTGDELLARYGIPTVTNIMGQELVLGTGAVDAVVVDMQCVIPGLKILADCFGTAVITTCASNRIPGATHVPFDPERPEQLRTDAMRIAEAAVAAFAARDRSRIRIPERVTRARVGWSYEAIVEAFGGAGRLAEELRAGTIRGLATVVGCNTPKVPYERNHVEVARRLVEAGVLVTTTGCASHALLNAGLCDPAAAELAPPPLRALLEGAGAPPVLAVGGCVDNARTLRLMTALSEVLGEAMEAMPYAFVGAEPGNEKTVGQGVSFLCHGVSQFSGFPAQIPVAVPSAKPGAPADDLDAGRNEIVEFFAGDGLLAEIGAKVFTDPDPANLAGAIRMHLRRKRLALGWEGPGAVGGRHGAARDDPARRRGHARHHSDERKDDHA